MPDFTSQRLAFRQLHEQGCFVIPNPWDIGSALFLQSLGFKAVATTSSGFAFSRGLPDSGDSNRRDEVLAHYADISNALSIPVNADFQSGYATSLEDLSESVQRCIETGVSGFSLEDATGDPSHPLYDTSVAVERLRVAREVIDASGGNVMLTARAECFLVGHPDPLNESIMRLRAYADAGADVLFAPCPATRENLVAIVDAAEGVPVNAIMSSFTGLSVGDLADLGVRRISVGSALARAAWTGFMVAAKKIADEGSFEGLDNLVSFRELEDFFGKRS